MFAHQVLGDECVQDGIGDQLDRVELVRGPKAVEEVDERQAGAQGSRMRDRGQVVRFLNRAGGQQRPACLAHRHHILVVAEDREPLGGKRAGCDMHDRAGQLTGDLVHVRDHQQQALRGGEGRAQRAPLEGSVQGAGGTALALHFDDRRDGSPDIGTALGGPLVGKLGHRRAGRDRIDRAQLAHAVRDMSGRFVPVDRRAGHDRPSQSGATNALPGNGSRSPIRSIAATGHCLAQVPQPVQRA